MKRLKQISLTLIAFLFLGLASANAGVSFSIGTGDFYLSVGDYDYLPYSYQSYPGYQSPRISFYQVMSEYGSWVYVNPFGQVWMPYASSGWRPYTQGHWIYTQYGPTWSGYEPWAWAAYHYGNWIFTSRYGWVWIPGYDWHPGRVSWARGYDTIGWTPLPPSGYDYSRGYLAHVGDYNQYSYYDDDFDSDGGYSYGGPYYDPRYRDHYYNSSYQNISINLWIFIGNNYFGYDNYADYYLPHDYCRYAFDRRLIRISNRPVDRRILERVVKQRIVEVGVEVKEIDTDQRRIKMIVPIGQEEKIRKNANITVRNVIAPAFAEKQKVFKGEKSKNKVVIDRIFKQENVRPKIETVSSDVLVENARVAKKDRDEKRVVVLQREKEKVEKVEKEGKIRGPKKGQEPEQTTGGGNQRDAPFENEKSKKQKNDVKEAPGNQGSSRKADEAVSDSNTLETEKKKKKKESEELPQNQRGNGRDSQSDKDNKAKTPSSSGQPQWNPENSKKKADTAPSEEKEENVKSKKDGSDEETVTEEDNEKDKDSDEEETKSKDSKSKDKAKKSSKSKSKDKDEKKSSDQENKPDRR